MGCSSSTAYVEVDNIRRPGKKHRARADPHAFGATDATASYAASGAASNHSTVPIMPHDSLADPSPSPSFISAPAACPGTSAENGISGSPSSGEEARREHSPTALDRRTEGVDLNIALEPMMTPQQYAAVHPVLARIYSFHPATATSTAGAEIAPWAEVDGLIQDLPSFIAAIVPLLRSPDALTRSNAAGALWQLSVANASNRAAIISCGDSGSNADNSCGDAISTLVALITAPLLTSTPLLEAPAPLAHQQQQLEVVQTESRRNAIRTLRWLCTEDVCNEDKLPRTTGSIAAIVALLSDPDRDCQQTAAATLFLLSCYSDPNRDAIREANGVSVLLNLLIESQVVPNDGTDVDSGPGSGSCDGTDGAAASVWELRRNVTAAVRKLSLNAENAEVIGNFSGIKALVKLLKCADQDVRRHAVGAFRNMAAFPATRAKFHMHGSIIILIVNLLDDEDDEIRQHAAAALDNICNDNDENKRRIREAGGVTKLLDLLQREQDDVVLNNATGAVWQLVIGNADNKEVVVKHRGAVLNLIGLLQPPSPLPLPDAPRKRPASLTRSISATAMEPTVEVESANMDSSSSGCNSHHAGAVSFASTSSNAIGALRSLCLHERCRELILSCEVGVSSLMSIIAAANLSENGSTENAVGILRVLLTHSKPSRMLLLLKSEPAALKTLAVTLRGSEDADWIVDTFIKHVPSGKSVVASLRDGDSVDTH